MDLGSNTLSINGTITRTGGTVTAGVASTVSVGGTGAQLNIPAGTFISNSVGNFTITRASGAVMNNNLSVSGILNLLAANPSSTVGCLETGTYSLLMGPSSTTMGPGDVNGFVTRSSFVANIPYTFGNQFTTFVFSSGGTLPTAMSIKITLGVAPAWKPDGIQRSYDIIHSGGSTTAVTMNLHYLHSELNSNPDVDLYPWDFQANTSPPMLQKQPRIATNTTDNWVSTLVSDIGYFGTVFNDHPWTLGKSFYVTFEGVKGWRMITSPTTTTSSDLLSNFITQGIPGSSFPAKQPNFLWFDETDTMTTNMSWRTTPYTSLLTKGRGYYLYVFDSLSGSYCDTLPRKMTSSGNAYFSGSFSFSGTNQHVTYTHRVGGQISQSPSDTIFYDTNIDDQGWNLMGNPTLSTLNWDATSGWTKTNMDNSIYIWDPAINQFRVWNGLIGSLGNGLISPYQAFWVKASSANPALSFNSSALTTGGTFYGGTSVKSQAVSSAPSEISLGLEASGLQSTALISFMDNAKTGPDEWDAYRLAPLSDSWLELFTLSSPAHTMPLVINNLPANGSDYINIPLFTGGQKERQSLGGTYTLTWELPTDWPSDWAIALQDHLNKKAISMRRTKSLTFDLAAAKSSNVVPDTNTVPVLPGKGK